MYGKVESDVPKVGGFIIVVPHPPKGVFRAHWERERDKLCRPYNLRHTCSFSCNNTNVRVAFCSDFVFAIVFAMGFWRILPIGTTDWWKCSLYGECFWIRVFLLEMMLRGGMLINGMDFQSFGYVCRRQTRHVKDLTRFKSIWHVGFPRRPDTDKGNRCVEETFEILFYFF